MGKCSAAAVAMATLLLFSGTLTRRSSAFTFRGHSRRRPLALLSQSTSTKATSFVSPDDDRFRRQVPDDWRGASEKKSEFITHFVAGRQPNLTVEAAVESLIASSQSADASAHRKLRRDTIVQREKDVLIRAADSALRHNTSTFPILPTGEDESLCAAELLALGSIWFLPSGAPRDAALGGKPIRLSASDVDKILEEGDYLRVHNPPRRFPSVNDYDWGAISGDATGRGVVVATDDEIGYMIVDKPAGLPVHGTVDNVLENVAAAVGRSLLEGREAELRQNLENKDRRNSEGKEHFDMTNSTDRKRKRKRDKQKKEPLVYISNPQRLDQNTSGLFVLSTKKEFASYFAKLLRKKTDVQLADDTRTDCAVHKTYRCLVCVSSGMSSTTDELARLRRYAEDGSTVRHWLQPSIKAPKTFAAVRGDSSWAECLLKVRQVGDAFPVVGSEAATNLSNALWEEKGSKPPECVAVVEVEIELLTGRTHQIRGQMSAEGFPLVGDIGYGGALPTPPIPRGNDSFTKSIKVPEKLALQCCQLEFIEPKYHRDKRDELVGVPSDTWKTFRLERAFWTPMLKRYSAITEKESASEATFSRSDEEDARKLQNVAPDKSFDVDSDGSDETAVHLPQRVKLSPGKNKYVVIEARSRSGETLQFVRSASPSECGGPYHADVARDVVRELTLLGYSCSVTGGGRIDYVAPHAHVYGFSYGFGKGDHELVAKIIEEQSEDETYATFDTSDGLY